VPCAAAAQLILTRDPSGAWTVDTDPMRAALDREMQRAVAVAMADPERIRTDGGPGTKIQVPVPALQSPASYRSFLAGLTVEVPPSWAWIVNAAISEQSAVINSLCCSRWNWLTHPWTMEALTGSPSSSIRAFG
jgi:hypothetical protein